MKFYPCLLLVAFGCQAVPPSAAPTAGSGHADSFVRRAFTCTLTGTFETVHQPRLTSAAVVTLRLRTVAVAETGAIVARGYEYDPSVVPNVSLAAFERGYPSADQFHIIPHFTRSDLMWLANFQRGSVASLTMPSLGPDDVAGTALTVRQVSSVGDDATNVGVPISGDVYLPLGVAGLASPLDLATSYVLQAALPPSIKDGLSYHLIAQCGAVRPDDTGSPFADDPEINWVNNNRIGHPVTATGTCGEVPSSINFDLKDPDTVEVTGGQLPSGPLLMVQAECSLGRRPGIAAGVIEVTTANGVPWVMNAQLLPASATNPLGGIRFGAASPGTSTDCLMDFAW
jgi:hypothetical protein